MLNRTQAPEIINPTEADISLPDIETRSLLSAVPLHIYNGGAQDVFKLEIYMPMGRWRQAKPLQASFLASMLKLGTQKKTSAEIARLEDFYGTSISIGCTADDIVISMQGLNKYMVDLVLLLKEILLSPTFPEHEFQNLRERSRQNFVINLSKSDFVAARRFGQIIFGQSHPYGIRAELADFDALTRNDIVDFYENTLSMDGAQIFISGKFEPNLILRVEEILNEILLNKNPEIKWSEKPPQILEQNISEVINDKAVQAAVGVGRYLFSIEDEDQIPFSMLNTVLGGYFGSRLMSNIREDKGYTYGIYSRYTAQRHACTMHISTDVNVDVVEDTVLQIRKEMDTLMHELVSEDELQVVKNYVFSSIISSVDGPFKIMDRWKVILLNGFSHTRFSQQIKIYRELSAEDLRRLAQKYFVSDSMCTLSVQ